MSNVLVGKVIEVSDETKYNNKGHGVLNVIVGSTREIVAGITENIKRTVVLFRDEATRAKTELRPGTCVIFTGAERSPRKYPNKRGIDVRIVEARAESFTVIDEETMEDKADALSKLALPDKAFVFTAADDKMLAEAEVRVKKMETSGDEEEVDEAEIT